MRPITITLDVPRRLKRTTDSEWQTETLQALQQNAEAIAQLEHRRGELLQQAREAGNPIWLLAAASGISRSHLYRLFPDAVKREEES